MTAKSITVQIVDDHALLRDMLKQRLDQEQGIEVVADAGNGAEAVETAGRIRPDILLMDIDMPGISAFAAARQIRASSPGTRIIFLSAYVNDSYINQALGVEAAGYVIKEHSLGTLLEAIRAVYGGGNYFSPEIESRLVINRDGVSLAGDHQATLQVLTQRELEVLTSLAKGLQKKEIGLRLGISPKTVDQHCSHIMMKLDLHDRVDLTRFAIREGLVDPHKE